MAIDSRTENFGGVPDVAITARSGDQGGHGYNRGLNGFAVPWRSERTGHGGHAKATIARASAPGRGNAALISDSRNTPK